MEGATGISRLYISLMVIIGIITAVTLFFIIYFWLYKRRINKTLKEGKSNKTPMFSLGSIALTVGIMIWACSTAFMLFQLQALTYYSNEQLNALQQQMNDLSRLQDEAGGSLFDINRKIDSQSFVEDYSFELGKTHFDTRMTEVVLHVMPRVTMGKTDKLTFRVGDSKTELKAGKDGIYTGTVQVSVFSESLSGILTWDNNGDKLHEFLYDDNMLFTEDSWHQFFPYIAFEQDSETGLMISIESLDSGMRIETDIIAHMYPAHVDENYRFTDMKLIFDNDGKVFKEVDLLKSADVKRNGDMYAYHLNETINVNLQDAKIHYHILAKDADGYTYQLYRYDAYGYDEENPYREDAVLYDKISSIFDKNGNIVKQFEESDFSFFFQNE